MGRRRVRARARRRGRLLRRTDARARRREPVQRAARDRVPDPRAAGRRRPEHHRRATTRRSSEALDRRGRRARDRRLRRRPAQLLRPQAGGVRRGVGGRLAANARVHRPHHGDRDPRDRPGHDGHDVPRRRRGAARRTGAATRELPQHFPRPGWVEHDPEEIWQSVLDAAARGRRSTTSDTIAITNQRETTLLWDRATGRPVAPAIVWQDRRTAERCRELDTDLIRERTGLVPDPYFSATKLEWLLARARRADGLAFGTVDTWLVWKLTGGAVHVTDATNASRTLLASSQTLDWDDELLALFGVDRELLPRIVRLRRGGRGGRAARARASRSAASRATSRRRSTARAATSPGEGEGDLRHRQLRARAHGRRCVAAAARAAEDGRGRRLRARRSGARRRRSDAVAARRARRPRPTRPRARRSRERRVERRRGLRARR